VLWKCRFALRDVTAVLVVPSLLFISGCGASQLPCVPAEVSVTVGGEPYGPCNVRMERKGAKPGERETVANIGKDGTGRFSTYKAGDGIPEGEYKVCVDPAGIGTPPFDKAYRSLASTPLTVQVYKNSDTVKLELEAKKGVAKGSSTNNLMEKLGAKSNEEMSAEAMNQ